MGFAAAILVAVLSSVIGVIWEIDGLTVFGVVLLAGVLGVIGKFVATMATHLSGSIGRLTTLNDRYDETEQWLEQFDRGTRAAFTSLSQSQSEMKAAIAELSKKLDSSKEALEHTEQKLTSQIEKSATRESLDAAVRSHKADIEGLGKKLESAREQDAKLSKRLDEFKGETKEIGRAIDELREAQERGAAESESSRGEVGEIREDLRKQKDEIVSLLDRKVQDMGERGKADAERLTQRLDQSSSVVSRLRGEGYVQFNRLLGNEFLKDIQGEKGQALGLKIEQGELRYLERKVQQVEALCEGRMATHADDAVARLLAARSCTSNSIKVLEIGVLFGVAAGFMHIGLSPFYENVHLTLLDPFDGYYGPEHLDPLTGQSVTRRAVERNLKRLAIDEKDVTILEGFSTEDTIRQQAKAGGPYDVVVIDGDHSYDGVKADFELYADLVESGGVLIVDDYGSEDWPDVTKYVDETIAKDKRFEQVGVLSRTAIFRRKDVPSGKKKLGTNTEQKSDRQKPTKATDNAKAETPVSEESARSTKQVAESPAAVASKEADSAPKRTTAKKATSKKTRSKKATTKKSGAKKAAKKGPLPEPKPEAKRSGSSKDEPSALAEEIAGKAGAEAGTGARE